MEVISIKRRRQTKWILILLCWTLLGFFISTQDIFKGVYNGSSFFWYRILGWSLVFCYIWFALTPGVLWFSRRFRFEKAMRTQSFLIHFAASLLFSIIHITFYTLIFLLVPAPAFESERAVSFSENFQILFVNYFHICLLSYWGILSIAYAINYYHAYQERALKAAQLETSLAQSQLQVLKMQLQPHFLFNTLNTISELVHEDAEAADQMIARLSTLLRTSLDTVGIQEVPLKEEIDFLQKYLDIEQIRFGERLKVQFSVPSDTLEALVPYMILQPLVENSVRYAVTPRAAGGQISIKAEQINNCLHLTICDEGQNFKTNAKSSISERVGLSNTRSRLQHLYGNAQKFNYQISSQGEMKVTIEIPFVLSANGA